MRKKSTFEEGLKVMIVGDYAWPWYQDACADALELIGCKVYRFGLFKDFKYWIEGHTEPFYLSFWHRLQYRFQFGPVVYNIKKKLIQKSENVQPDVVWFYNVHLIGKRTIKKLRRLLPKTIFVQYSNDDPFSEKGTFFLWRKFLLSIQLFHCHFAYRSSNIADFRAYGVENVHLLRSYFIPECDYPELSESIPEHFKCDVVFAGHYEDDGRIEMLESICQAGFDLNLYGGGWDRALKKLKANSPLLNQYPVAPVTGADYRYAICGAKVAICFLSKLNNDSYTRRNFQIPAMGTAMLSEYTEDLATLYISDKEAMFFKDNDEMLRKLKVLMESVELRKSIAKAGYARVQNDGHDVVSRMAMWLEVIKKTKEDIK